MVLSLLRNVLDGSYLHIAKCSLHYQLMPDIRSCNMVKAQDQAVAFKRSDRSASSEGLTLQKAIRVEKHLVKRLLGLFSVNINTV